MSLVYQKNLFGKAAFGLWEISETTDELLALTALRPDEKEMFSTFRTDWRKNQWLAYRALIRMMLPEGRNDIHYDEIGKPYLAGKKYHISVTHSGNLAGVILSASYRVGIDTEKVRERIARVRDKFLCPEEQEEITGRSELFLMTLGWCAKEAVYKLHACRELDFREEIRVIFPGKGGSGQFQCRVSRDGSIFKYQMHYEFFGDYLVVTAVE